jgi:hypothetical protein
MAAGLIRAPQPFNVGERREKMAAGFPTSERKYSYVWLKELLLSEVDHEGSIRRMPYDGMGLIFYHLRHLGLIREELIDFEADNGDEQYPPAPSS